MSRFECVSGLSVYWPIIALGTRECGVAKLCRDPTVQSEFFLRVSQHLIELAGHPLRGCPARLRGHKGSGLWKVWTVPSPPLPPLPSFPSLPPSRVPNLIKLGPAVWPKLQPAEARECSAALAISEWTRRLFAMLIIARRKMLF